MNVEEVYNLEQKVAVSYPTVTAVGFAVTPRGSPRGGGVSSGGRRQAQLDPDLVHHLREAFQCVTLSLFLRFMLAYILQSCVLLKY